MFVESPRETECGVTSPGNTDPAQALLTKHVASQTVMGEEPSEKVKESTGLEDEAKPFVAGSALAVDDDKVSMIAVSDVPKAWAFNLLAQLFPVVGILSDWDLVTGGERFKDLDFKSQWKRWQKVTDQQHGLLEWDAYSVIEDGPHHKVHLAPAPSQAILLQAGPGMRSLPNNNSMWLIIIGLVGTVTLCVSASRLPSSAMGYVACTIYLVVSVTIDISIAIQKTSQTQISSDKNVYDFNPKCAVFLTEFIKLVVSLGLASFNAFNKGEHPNVQLQDATWLLLPAMFFTVNNILVYQAIGKNDMAAFGVFRDTMILWTALIWRAFFSTELGWKRLAGIVVIFGGLTLNRAGLSAWSWAFLWVLVMTLTNATGSVVNEFALKRNKTLDINVQNSILYVACGVFAILLLAVEEPSRLSGPTAFFQGFTGLTFFTLSLQAFAGLIVSRMLKYADSVTKTVACCLRGPTVVFISPYVLGVSNSWSGIISAVVVAAGCTIYLLCGPLAPPPQAPKDEDSRKSAAVA